MNVHEVFVYYLHSATDEVNYIIFIIFTDSPHSTLRKAKLEVEKRIYMYFIEAPVNLLSDQSYIFTAHTNLNICKDIEIYRNYIKISQFNTQRIQFIKYILD